MKDNLKLALLIIALVCIVALSLICKNIEDNKYLDDVSQVEINSVKLTDIPEPTKSIEVTEVKLDPISLGYFKLTAYCPCEECCGHWANNRPNGIVYGACGEELKENYSIAVDPDVIPYGTEVMIDGNTYKAQDCGGEIDGQEIDVYFLNHDDALNFGVQYAEVLVTPHTKEAMDATLKSKKENKKDKEKPSKSSNELAVEETKNDSVEEVVGEEWESMGAFKITFYCDCKKCNGKWHGHPTASGTEMVEGRTIAVDKSVIPLGTEVKIEGWGYYTAEDTGVSGKQIDIFLESHEMCYEYGKQQRQVWVKK